MPESIEFVTETIPEPGEIFEISPGILWIRMPLPFRLNHINLWMIEGQNGWSVVDTGVNSEQTKTLWQGILDRTLQGKPIDRLVCTHAHPDHMGLAGWFSHEHGAGLMTTREEWAFGRMVSTGALVNRHLYSNFFRLIGCAEADLEAYGTHIMTAEDLYDDVPHSFDRFRDGSIFEMGDHNWEVIVGLGHSLEHACLYCHELNVLIAGDQVLPKITPTIMVQAQEPEANPLDDFLSSNEKLRGLPGDVLVLPSHNRPFVGLHTRLDQYIAHHEERLSVVLEACQEPSSGIEVTNVLFTQELDFHGKYFASGEAMAHIRYLEDQGKLTRILGNDGVERYQRV